MNIKDEIRRINEQARSICFTTRELQKELDTLSKPSVVSVDSIINTVIEVAEKVSNQRDMVVVVDLAKLSPSIHNLMTKGQKGVKPLRHMHSITHDYITHPHETIEDMARNKGLDEYEKAITDLFNREV